MTTPALDSIDLAQSMNNGDWNQYWNTLSKYTDIDVEPESDISKLVFELSHLIKTMFTGDEPNNPEQWFEWQRRNAHARAHTGGPDGLE